MLSEWYEKPTIVITTDADRRALRHVQKVFGIAETGELDEEMRGHLRGFQRLFGLPATGVLDPATAEQVERIWPFGA